MKNAKKLLALLLALVMLFAFCACGNGNDKDDDKDDKKESSSQSDKDSDKDDDKDSDKDSDKDNDKDDTLTEAKLEGDWEATLDLAALAYMMGEDVSMYEEMGIKLDTCTLDMVFEDGEATIKMSGMVDWYVDMMEDVIDWCYEGDNMLEFVAAMMSDEETEYTAKDIEEMLDEEGMTIDDVLDQYFGEMDLDEMADELAGELDDETMDYELDGDELIFDDAVWTFTYSNGKIYITSIEEDGETIELSKGDLVLEKK